MAERVRRFRVKFDYPYQGIKKGDIGTFVEMHGSMVKLHGPSSWKTNADSTCVVFDISNLEELTAFAVGDAVRAKAGDGSKWVAKKPVDSSPKPAIVCLREDGLLKPGTARVHDSTNAAFADAEVIAKDNPGKEYVVLQEKGSKRVEPVPSAAEAVALAISGEIKDKHMSTWKFRDGTSFGVVPVRMNWDYGSDEVTIRVRCHRPA